MERIWSYFIQLGSNMWRQTCSPTEHRGPTICQATGRYCQTMHTDRNVWREVVDFLPSCGFNMLIIDIGEGLCYESHPELSICGAWTKDELRSEVVRLRSMGIEPVPKLNFSSFHDTWLGEYAYMKGTAKYYAVVKELIDEVCEVFAPVKYFHVGMDEEDVPNHKKAITIIRSPDMWYHDLRYYMQCVEKHGARTWIWGSYYRTHGDTFAQNVPKECLISESCFERLAPRTENGKFPRAGLNSLMDFSRMGYDFVANTSTWACHQSTAQTVLFFHNEGLISDHFFGFVCAPWQFTDEVSRYNLLDAAYRTKFARELFESYLN